MLGATFDWRGASLPAVARLAQAADELGFKVFWVPEAWGLEAFSTISHILTTTKKITVGSGIVNVYSRSAALIAMGAATISQLAPERFALGLGVSGRRLVEGWHGVVFEDPFGRLLEYLDVVKMVLGGGQVEYSGRHLRLSGFRLYTQPPAKPPKLFLAALGGKSLRLAAQRFDGAILAMYPASKLREAAATLASAGKEAHYFVPVALKPEGAGVGDVGYIAKTIAFYVASMGDYYHRNLVRLGFAKEADAIRQMYRGGDREGAFREAHKLLGELALVGTPSEVAEKIRSMPKNVTPVLSFRASSLEDAEAASKVMRAISEALAA